MDTERTATVGNAGASSSGRVFVYLALVAIAVLFVMRMSADVESAVAWGMDLPTASAEARDNGKPLLINFSSPGCIYCKRMEAEVFPQAEVLAEIAGMVPVKIDAWADGETAARYGVEGLPTYFVARADGTPLLELGGFVGAEEFVRFLRAGKEAVAAAK